MKYLIAILLLLFTSILYSQNNHDTTLTTRFKKNESKIEAIDKQNTSVEIGNIKSQLDFIQKQNEQANTNISNQISAASFSLNFIGILFTLIAILLGLYVTYIERKVFRISEKNKELLIKSQKIKDEVEAVNNLIQSDIPNLYLKIKREETTYILDRLIKKPKEIKEVGYTLLSRELLPEDFLKIRQAYLEFNSTDYNYNIVFVQILIKHFLAQSLKDEQLRKNFSGYIGTIFTFCIDSEIVKCTSDLASVLIDKGVQEYKKEINLFFSGLASLQLKGDLVVIQHLFNNLRTRKNRFDTYASLDPIPHISKIQIAFGNLLLNQYSTDNLTESERLTFIELSNLKEAQKRLEDASNQNQVKEKDDIS